VDAGQLRIGDELLALDGGLLRVDFLRKLPFDDKVYNIEVEDYHTYTVGGSGVLVHNNCTPDGTESRTITPHNDPARPGWNNGATHVDHAQARSLGGTNHSSNLRELAAETNLRKGGHEGALKAYEEYLMRNGMSRQSASSVIQAEIDAMKISPPPRPMDPRVLDGLPAS